MGNQATQNQNTTNDIIGSDDDFLAELEAELNADGVETPDAEEVGSDDVVAADAEPESNDDFEVNADADTKAPAKKAATKKKTTAKKKTAAKKAAEKTEEKGEEVGEEAGEETGEPEKVAAPKRQSLSGMLPSQALHTAMGDKVYEHCIMTPKQKSMTADARKLEIDEHLANVVDGLAKKVKEKAINVFLAVSGQANLSVYTQVALKLLKDKGEFSGTELKDRYLSRPYSPGTASAQSSQMMQLLPALHIATREGNKLVLNEDSPLFDLLINE